MMATPAAFLTNFDLHLLGEGQHYESFDKLGAHLREVDGVHGTNFAVWAPDASRVSVVGDFNEWQGDAHSMSLHEGFGVWETFIPGVKQGALYKYRVVSRTGAYRADKADPYGFAAEIRPHTASKVWDIGGYEWGDAEWLAARAPKQAVNAPVSIYEVHLGSWMRVPEEGNRWLTYREAAPKLVEYVHHMGFTHVELLPITEHPFDGSWGYQTVGYYAPTSRFGTPQDFMYLVDTLHQNGIGVILDWVPAHFPTDEHGLGYFDGTHLYEHADPRQGQHPHWGTLVFNFGRREVGNFLISNALFWMEHYHVDGMRVDAVASLLYLDFGRDPGQWIPNRYGGRENIEAIEFIRTLNEVVHDRFPGAAMIAEESSSWPMVSRPVYLGGLGFDFKWSMGWMHDMLDYMSKDPVYRPYHHNKITFSMMYAFSENFVLPLSHDEVVHGKGSMILKMPGDDWQRFANLRALYGFMFFHPGKKLLFMGNEFGEWKEWNHDESLDWSLLERPFHSGLQRWVRDLNTLYRGNAALWELDTDWSGFQWIDANDSPRSIISLRRKSRDPNHDLICICNLTPEPRHNYRIGVPARGDWRERLNGDAVLYGGSGQGNLGTVSTTPIPMHGHPHSLNLTLPPLAMIALERAPAT